MFPVLSCHSLRSRSRREKMAEEHATARLEWKSFFPQIALCSWIIEAGVVSSEELVVYFSFSLNLICSGVYEIVERMQRIWMFHLCTMWNHMSYHSHMKNGDWFFPTYTLKILMAVRCISWLERMDKGGSDKRKGGENDGYAILEETDLLWKMQCELFKLIS